MPCYIFFDKKGLGFMYLTMKNFELKVFGDFLYELSLKGKESRMRSRFIALIEAQLELIQKERDILLKDYAKTDENGEVITEQDENGNPFMLIGDATTFNLEMAKLMQEEFIIEIKDDNREMLRIVAEAVLNVDKEFSGFEAESYNRLCDVLEPATL